MEKRVLAALGKVIDPDLKKDLVTLGMIMDVEADPARIKFTLELTTPACPLKDKLKKDCIAALQEEFGEGIQVDIDITSRVTTQRDDTREKLAGIRNIIAVSSGKGGVGKSTIASNLAIALSMQGARTGLLDADIHGPSIPTMLQLKGKRPGVEERGDKVTMLPVEQYGIKVMSIGMLIEENQPIVWRGPMLSSALKQLFTDTKWGELDYLIIDLPPGTGDIHLTLGQQFPVTGALMVTTPQQVALSDVRKSLEMYRQPQINIPLLGVVENMSWFIPKELPDNKYYLFGKGGGEAIAGAYDVPLLARIPLAMGVAEEADEGIPAILDEESPIYRDLMDMAQKVAQRIAIVNAEMASAPAT